MTNIDASREMAPEFKPKFTGTKASNVATGLSQLAAPPLSDDDEFVIMNEGSISSTTAVMEVDGGKGEASGSVVRGATAEDLKNKARSGQWNNYISVEHNTSGRVTMYKPTPDGWMPRVVASTAIRVLRGEGWKSTCGDCGGHHGGELNDCPSRPKVKYGLCPVCGLRIHDSYQQLPVAIKAEEDAEGDENLLVFEEFGDSTPESRIKAAITTHMWYKHPRSSSERGISEPAAPPAELIATMMQKRGG